MLVSDRPRPMLPAAMAAWITSRLLREVEHPHRQRAEERPAEAVVGPLRGELGEQLPRHLALGFAQPRRRLAEVVVQHLRPGGRCPAAAARPAKPWSMLRLRSSSSTISAPCPTRSTRYSGRCGPASANTSAASASAAAPRSAQPSTCDGAVARHQREPAVGQRPCRGANSGSSGQRQQPQHPGVRRRRSKLIGSPRSASRQRRHSAHQPAPTSPAARALPAPKNCRARGLRRSAAGRRAAARSRRARCDEAHRGRARTAPRPAAAVERRVQLHAGGAPGLVVRLRRQAAQRAPGARERPVRAAHQGRPR